MFLHLKPFIRFLSKTLPISPHPFPSGGWSNLWTTPYRPPSARTLQLSLLLSLTMHHHHLSRHRYHHHCHYHYQLPTARPLLLSLLLLPLLLLLPKLLDASCRYQLLWYLLMVMIMVMAMMMMMRVMVITIPPKYWIKLLIITRNFKGYHYPPHLHRHHCCPHFWEELNKLLLLIVRAGTVADLDGHVSPLQRQFRSFSPSNWTPLFPTMNFIVQVFARKCHLLGLARPGFGLGKERGRGGGENLEELVWFLPGCWKYAAASTNQLALLPILTNQRPGLSMWAVLETSGLL